MVLGISCDTTDENRAFREKFDFPFKLLSDTDRTVSLAYGAVDSTDGGYPARISYLIGPDGTVRKAYAKVSPADHPGEVLRDLG